MRRFWLRSWGWSMTGPALPGLPTSFSLVYTPFHGTGYQLIPEALKRLGMKHVLCVPEQMVIDGDFPTVASPNPENAESFALAGAGQGPQL